MVLISLVISSSQVGSTEKQSEHKKAIDQEQSIHQIKSLINQMNDGAVILKQG